MSTRDLGFETRGAFGAHASALAAFCAVALCAGHADAQRRGRWHPRGGGATQTANSPDAGAPTGTAVDTNPFDAPQAGTGTTATTGGGTGGTTATTPPGGTGTTQAGTAQGGTGQLGAQNAPPQGNPAGGGNAATTGAGAAGTPPTDTNTVEDTGPPMPDLTPIRDEYTGVMDDLVQARARVATLGRSLFQTKVRVRLVNRATARVSLASAAVYLDGAPVYRGTGAELREQATQLFDGFAAPGPHELVIEIEQRARDGDTYRYTLRDSFRFEVTRERLTEVTLTLDDGSGIATDFRAGGEGQYDARVVMRVATRALDAR